jgi:hypothetical protein
MQGREETIITLFELENKTVHKRELWRRGREFSMVMFEV